MTNLTALKDASDAAYARFEEVSSKHYLDGVWGAYRAYDAHKDTVPIEVIEAMYNFRNAIQAYYMARDGDKGFLGGRGA
jgi:hypothetical protein